MQLVATNLSLKLGKRRVLQRIDLEVPGGEIHALLGAAGSGKSLLVECLAGLRPYDEGEVFLRGEPLAGRKALSRLGVVFAQPNFFSHLSMQRNLELALARRAESENAIHHTCERLRISHLLGALPGDLTSWQGLQMQLARALLNEPDALALDVPFEQIPAGYHNTLRILLAEEAARGTAVLFTTSLPRQAQLAAGKIALLEQGAIVQYATPREFYSAPQSLFVANVFFDQGFGVIPGVISKRLKNAFDCTLVGEFEVRIPCPKSKLLDFSGAEVLLGAHSGRIGFSQPDEPAIAVKGRHILSREPGDCHISLWRLGNGTILEARTSETYQGATRSELWIGVKGLVVFDEYGSTLACL